MDKPRHPNVIRTWKVERLKQRTPPSKAPVRRGKAPAGKPERG